MVAAKSFLATALVLAALLASAATAADAPRVRITSADQARAVAALLRRSDFGAGWQGGETGPGSLGVPSCPGFAPNESGLIVTGHADARFTFAPGDVVLDQDVEVLSSAAEVREDFARTISPRLASCLAYQIDRSPKVASATVERIPFPSTGSASAAYRATVVFRGSGLDDVVLSDFVFFAVGRVEYSFNVIAPLDTRSQLVRFELALAEVILRRTGP